MNHNEHKNQCDGCMKNVPIQNGIHKMGENHPDYMYCTKDKYTPPPNPMEDKECKQHGKVQANIYGNCPYCGLKVSAPEAQEEEWEKEFAKQFPMLTGIKVTPNFQEDFEKAMVLQKYWNNLEDNLKSFIRSLLTDQKSKILWDCPNCIGEHSNDNPKCHFKIRPNVVMIQDNEHREIDALSGEEWEKREYNRIANEVRSKIVAMVKSSRKQIPSRDDRGSMEQNILQLERIRTAEGYNQAVSEIENKIKNNEY